MWVLSLTDHVACFCQGLTAGGDNYMYVPISTRSNKNQLQEICRNDSFCVGKRISVVSLFYIRLEHCPLVVLLLHILDQLL